MREYTIKSVQTGSILYAGTFKSFAACLEAALAENISLKQADLRFTNLLCADLDGIDLDGAHLSGANLTGANLSEASLRNTDFSNTGLYGTVFCESDLSGANFDGALFGGTDICGACMKDCIFSTLSAYLLDFRLADTVEGCIFIDPDGLCSPFSRPPLVIRGLSHPLMLTDRHIRFGNTVHPINSLPPWIASGLLTPDNLRLRLEQITLAGIYMTGDKLQEIA